MVTTHTATPGEALPAFLITLNEALRAFELRDEDGNAVGWIPLDGARPDDLAETVWLLTDIEAMLRGLRLSDPEQLVADSEHL